MKAQLHRAVIWSLGLSVGIAATGCPATNHCTTPCPDQEACDPADGLCKCGGSQGVVCAPNEHCDATQQICLTDHCQGKSCANGNTCDPSDGVCKCSGAICGAGNVCLDPDAGGCQPDLCYGVQCAGADEGVQCILGVCRCGKADGMVSVDDPVCNRIEHCRDGQCIVPNGCDSLAPCPDYEICNPQDLKCHCGSPLGPICSPSNPCIELGTFDGGPGTGNDAGPFFACRTENDCGQVTCTAGEICDPNQNFNCVCETEPGLGGPSCEPDEYCIALDATKSPECARTCSVYTQQDCQIADAGPLNCYAELSSGAAVCEPPNPHGVGAEGVPCLANADCAPGLGCWTHAPNSNGDAGPVVSTCATYCDAPTLSMQNSQFPCVPPEYCTPVAQVQGSGGLLQIGFCQ